MDLSMGGAMNLEELVETFLNLTESFLKNLGTSVCPYDGKYYYKIENDMYDIEWVEDHDGTKKAVRTYSHTLIKYINEITLQVTWVYNTDDGMITHFYDTKN